MSDFDDVNALHAAYAAERWEDLKDIARRIPAEDLTAVLLDRGNFDTTDGYSYIPILETCITRNQTDLLTFFVDCGLDVNVCIYPGLPLICHACREKKAEMVLVLLALGADPNSTDRKIGDSLLHTAAMHFGQSKGLDTWDIIESLLLAGAYTGARNEESKRPIDYIPEGMQSVFVKRLARSYLQPNHRSILTLTEDECRNLFISLYVHEHMIGTLVSKPITGQELFELGQEGLQAVYQRFNMIGENEVNEALHESAAQLLDFIHSYTTEGGIPAQLLEALPAEHFQDEMYRASSIPYDETFEFERQQSDGAYIYDMSRQQSEGTEDGREYNDEK